MPVEVEDTGCEGVKKVILSNGMSLVELYSFGAQLNRWIVKDKKDNMVDILLGFDTVQGWCINY